MDTYSVTFNDKDYNKVEIKVVVTPTDFTTTQSQILNGVLIPIEYATTQGVRMSWEFTDSTRGKPDQFDAYNLSVTISGGSGYVVITWENDKLDIDPFFLKKVNATPKVNGTTSTLTIRMNSEDATSAYLIQFYNHNQAKPDWKAWNELPITVALASE